MVSGYEHKVLFISTEMHLGGAEKSLLAVLKHPAPVGFEAILICRPDSQIGDAARELGVSVLWHPMEQRDLTKKPFAYLRALFVLWRKLAPMGPSLLFGDGWRAIPYAVPLGRVLRKPSLMHIRDTDIPPSL